MIVTPDSRVDHGMKFLVYVYRDDDFSELLLREEAVTLMGAVELAHRAVETSLRSPQMEENRRRVATIWTSKGKFLGKVFSTYHPLETSFVEGIVIPNAAWYAQASRREQASRRRRAPSRADSHGVKTQTRARQRS